MPAPVPIGPTPLLVRLRIVLPIDPAVVMKARQQPATPPPLPYHFVDQEEPNWCWAAVAEGVAHTYDPASSSSQCGIANAVLGRLDCCPPPGGNHPCNCTHNLVDPLKEVGRYGGRTPPPSDWSATPSISDGWSVSTSTGATATVATSWRSTATRPQQTAIPSWLPTRRSPTTPHRSGTCSTGATRALANGRISTSRRDMCHDHQR